MIDWIQKSGMGDDAMKETMNMANEEGMFGMNLTELEQAEKNYTFERNNLIDTYKSWSGTDYIGQFKSSSEIGADEFGKFADGGNDGSINLDGTSPLNPDYKETNIDKDNDAVPDTVDIDAGTGTNEPVSTMKKVSLAQAKELGGKQLVEKYIRGEIDKDTMKSLLDKSDLDDDYLDLFGQQKLWTIVGPIKTGTGEQLLRGEPTANVRTDDYMASVDNAAKKIDEWLNIDKSISGSALNEYLLGNITQSQAAVQGGKKISGLAGKRDRIVGRKAQTKINNFKNKFIKAQEKGISLQDFIKNNDSEYRNIAKLIKYGRYFFKPLS